MQYPVAHCPGNKIHRYSHVGVAVGGLVDLGGVDDEENLRTHIAVSLPILASS